MPGTDSWRHVADVLATILANLHPLRPGASPLLRTPGRSQAARRSHAPGRHRPQGSRP